MNRYQVTSDGVILDRWHAENGFECVAFPAAGWGTSMPETPQAIARQWNRDEIQAAARRRGVKP